MLQKRLHHIRVYFDAVPRVLPWLQEDRDSLERQRARVPGLHPALSGTLIAHRGIGRPISLELCLQTGTHGSLWQRQVGGMLAGGGGMRGTRCPVSPSLDCALGLRLGTEQGVQLSKG